MKTLLKGSFCTLMLRISKLDFILMRHSLEQQNHGTLKRQRLSLHFVLKKKELKRKKKQPEQFLLKKKGKSYFVNGIT